MNTPLSSCPFCGGTNAQVTKPHGGEPVHYVVICTPEVDRPGCGASSPQRSTPEAAVEA